MNSFRCVFEVFKNNNVVLKVSLKNTGDTPLSRIFQKDVKFNGVCDVPHA